MIDLATLQNFHFLRPAWLLALFPFALLTLFAVTRRDALARWRGVIAPHLLHHLLIEGGHARRINPTSVGLLLMALMVLAMAGPAWQRKSSPFATDEAALVIALDASASMDQSDVQPSRLERAKQKVSDLLATRAGARTALVVYAGSAHGVIPLSNDPDVVRNFLDAVETTMMPRPGKRLSTVLPLLDAALVGSNAPTTVLVISDAVIADDIVAIRQYFSAWPHQLLVLGVGEQNGVRGFDEDALRELARAGNGHYQSLTLNDTDVQRLAGRIRNHLVMAEDRLRPWSDAGGYLTLPIALLLLLWFRKGWTLRLGVALFALGLAGASPPAAAEWHFADLWLRPDQQGRFYFERGDYTEAATRFRDPAWQGVALYMAGDFQPAAQVFASVDSVDGLYNLGNAWAQTRNYVYAVQSYDRALARDPQHVGAQHNRALVQAIIDEINALSESQQPEPGERSQELGDQPLTAEGAEKTDYEPREQRQYSAAEILADPAINELWMRQIQQNPARFLAVKFQMQLQQREQQSESDAP